MRRFWTIVACVALAFATMQLGTPSYGFVSCGPHKLCIFSGTNFTGTKLVISSDLGVSDKLGHSALEDNSLSAENRTAHPALIADEPGGKGAHICIPPHSSVSDFSTIPFLEGSSTQMLRQPNCPP